MLRALYIYPPKILIYNRQSRRYIAASVINTKDILLLTESIFANNLEPKLLEKLYTTENIYKWAISLHTIERYIKIKISIKFWVYEAII